MKKFLALALTLLMTLSSFAAVAETQAPELPFEGTYVPFEDYGFAICLPNDWNVMEVPEESAASGMFFIAVAPDGSRTVQLQYAELPAKVEGIDGLVADLSTQYEGVKAAQINGIDFAVFTIAESDINALVCLGSEGTAMFGFYFTPASDAEFAPIAEAIAGSITTDYAAE